MGDVKGITVPTKQRPESEWIKGQGWTTFEVWEGPTKESVYGLVPGLQTTHERIQITSDGLIWKIRAATPTIEGGVPEDVVDTWELLGQGMQEDLLTHPKAQALDDDELRKILEAINNPESGVTPALTTPDAIDLYGLLLNKQNTYLRSQFNLRHTTNVSSFASFTVSMANLETIHTNGQLPGGIPATIQAAILAITPPLAVPSGYTWGWLKQTPQIIQTFNSRLLVIEEWWLYSWSTFVYANAA